MYLQSKAYTKKMCAWYLLQCSAHDELGICRASLVSIKPKRPLQLLSCQDVMRVYVRSMHDGPWVCLQCLEHDIAIKLPDTCLCLPHHAVSKW